MLSAPSPHLYQTNPPLTTNPRNKVIDIAKKAKDERNTCYKKREHERAVAYYKTGLTVRVRVRVVPHRVHLGLFHMRHWHAQTLRVGI